MKEDIRRIYDGSLFYEIAARREEEEEKEQDLIRKLRVKSS